MTKQEAARKAVEKIYEELITAMENHNPMNSAHEGYAVIAEEFDELKEEIWKNSRKRDYVAMQAEAVQVGAMAARLIVDITFGHTLGATEK